MSNKLVILISFLTVFAIHFIWVSSELEPNAVWADSIELSEQAQLSGYDLYFKDGEYFLGLSFAFAIAFTVFAISRVKADKKKGFIGNFRRYVVICGTLCVWLFFGWMLWLTNDSDLCWIIW